MTVNRPDKLNALNDLVIAELGDAIDVARLHPDVSGVILTGAGRAFVAGADISELEQLGAVTAKALAQRGQDVFRRIETCPKPTIAAVNGFALGGGCELAMACHMRIASEAAKFGQPEVKLGLVPGYGGTQRLPRLVGKGRALQLLLTGEMIDAQEAFRIGLVNRVVPAADLLSTAKTMLADDHRQRTARHRGVHRSRECRLRSSARRRAHARGDGVRSARGDQRQARGHARVSRKARAGVHGRVMGMIGA